MHGEGEYEWANSQKKYKGQWFCSKQHGRGTMTLENGERISGEWINGLRIYQFENIPEKEKEKDNDKDLVESMKISSKGSQKHSRITSKSLKTSKLKPGSVKEI